MTSVSEYELLIPASQDYVFRFYQDCYHWNVWFQGIEQSWFEREPRDGVQGKIIFENGARWNLRVSRIYDDRIMTIHARRYGVTLVFEAEMEPVRDDLTKVSHRIYFPGLLGSLWQALWGKRLVDWLQMNLYVLASHAKIRQQEQQKLVNKNQPKTKTKKKRKPQQATKG